MRRTLKWIGWSVAILVAVPAVLVLVVLAGANTAPGQALIARLAPRLTGGLVTMNGLSGRFPDRLYAAQLSLHDKDGIWATIDDLELDWSPLRLVAGDIAIQRIAATKSLSAACRKAPAAPHRARVSRSISTRCMSPAWTSRRR